MYGFGICYVAGLVINFISAFFFFNITMFAFLYTLGNILSLGLIHFNSTSFLFGPLNQLKKMFDKDRIVATLLYLGALVLTIILVVVKASVVLILLCVIFQSGALFWYSLSYIPFGRAAVLNCFKGVFK
ncbi:Vesicle transport protein, Got1/SFT2-like domain-containing protein [Rozella allomycis CSF55]|uniref:Protein transport protein SFT2 n=1 Tax=Rozella allomycis (strain CSF55) TaxID=988480 RepID=A0A075B2N4_ROZAC|nr:Vesicle transport protein, Got1/SFT2-like domain-containing protein [Rozella allomycis CSF55]|eukprot:EPZ35063.1 Vesicle transport protein, Got1/SFT2-like domain-containing protein [Rozella allomycis CSF55]